MNKQIVSAVLVALVIGFAGGYAVGSSAQEQPTATTHVMSDGTMMENSMDSMVDALKGKSGDELDKTFIEEMIVHHEGAVAMAQTLLAGTQRPELIKLGNDIVKAQTAEIEQMKRWLAEWYGS